MIQSNYPTYLKPSPELKRSAEPDVVDVRFLFGELWRRKFFLLLFAAIGAAYGAYQVYGFTPKYRATIVVAPAQTQQQVGASSALSTFASEIGLSPKEETPITFERFKIIVGSVELAEILQNKYQLLHRINASSWDAKTQSWIKPTGGMFELREWLHPKLRLNIWSEPNLETLANYVSSKLKIKQKENNPFVEIRFEHSDPDFAYWFLTTVFSEADELLRQRDRVSNSERIAYLRDRLGDSSITEVRRLLLSMLMAEESNSMLLQGSRAYSADIIEPAFVSGRLTEPAFGRLFYLPMMLGFGIATMFVVVLAVVRHEGQRSVPQPVDQEEAPQPIKQARG